ncbi:serine protease [Granulosicoccaceae sp. 1_MG-2023]|nr:serine protease [Granulosicoccaceae sp. 1_MG-2023]
MKPLASTLLALGLFAAAAGIADRALASECEWPDRRTQASVLPITTDDGSYASAVVIGRNRVITAAHAVHEAIRTFVRIGDEYREGKVLSMDAGKDLAVIEVDTSGLAPIRLSRREPHANQRVWAIGFPQASSKTTSLGQFNGEVDGALHTSAPIDAGESGGGLLTCEQGDFVLAGMLRGYGAYRRGNEYVRIENHSVSVAARDIEEFVFWRLH